jgi:exonuclease VII large subunit
MNISGVDTGWKLGMDLSENNKDKTAAAGASFADVLSKVDVPKGTSAAELLAKKKAENENRQNEFLDHMKKTPAERMEEAWLRARGLTKEDLEAMEPEKRAALIEEMKQQIEDQIRREAEQKAKSPEQPLVA